jgi:hypothetical protein
MKIERVYRPYLTVLEAAYICPYLAAWEAAYIGRYMANVSPPLDCMGGCM